MRHGFRTAALASLALVTTFATVDVAPARGAPPGQTQTYLVLAPEGNGTAKAVGQVSKAGGTVVAAYSRIGVVVATSSRPDFASAVKGRGVEAAAPTTGLGTPVETAVEETEPPEDPATVAEPLWAQQWDMRAIDVAQAHAVTVGSPSVVVGILDSGIDDEHPDLAEQVDDSLSASCVGGVPDPTRAAWRPTTSDHGTHVAGIVAAARNDFGIVGVAPSVRLASVKVANDDGFFYPEAVLCGLMWAADHGFEVTNNSYFIDPWEFHCRDDAGQRAVWIAVQRALAYASGQGVVNVANAGNRQFDLAGKGIDSSSPNDGSAPVEDREVNNACAVLPAEARDVITVSATGPTGIKAFYSNYGLGVIDVAAPGGDSRVPGDEPNGRVFSTIWPGGGYGYKQGTSMATAHVAGVVALVRSVSPALSPAAVADRLERTAEPRACPPGGAYTPPGETVAQYCRGGEQHNGFYGYGEVSAYHAVMG